MSAVERQIAKTAGRILVGDGNDLASVAVSGDATLSAAGAVTIQAGAVETAMLLQQSKNLNPPALRST